MPGEKTEKATPKKRRDSRKEGEVVKSVELQNCITLAAASLALKLLWDGMIMNTKEAFTLFLGQGDQRYEVLDIVTVSELFKEVIMTLFIIAFPIMVIVMISGVLSSYLQVGFMFSPKALMVKGSRISPIQGFKKIFSKQALMGFLKSVMKMAFIFLMGYSVINTELPKLINLIQKDIEEAVKYGLDLAMTISFRILIGLTVVAVADYIFQWFSHEKKLKMSKQEVKDEHKNMEGDPEITGMIRRKQREMASMRMMKDVPESDVVITNPTHFAVAIKYDLDESAAPIVVAKGADNIAQKIKEIAIENNVEIVENVEVARSLYKSTEIGEQIPIDMFRAVAEILSYVYKLKGKSNEF